MLNFARLVQTTISTAKRVLTARFRMLDQTGDDDSGGEEDQVEVVQPAGLLARVPVTSTAEAVTLDLGEQLVVIALVDKAAPVQDVEDGETRLYGVNGSNNNGAKLRLRADGTVEIVSHSGKKLKLMPGGASAGTPVAVEGSQTTGHIHNVSFALTAPPGGGTVTGSITVITSTDTIATGQGAQGVLAQAAGT